jgi:hypothetical protein
MTTTTYRVIGTTDDITTCDVCGRPELKGTVALDADGETTYAGTTCAARLAGRTTLDIRSAARAADRARIDAEDAARREAAAVEDAAFLGWVADTYGVHADQPGYLWDRIPGMTPHSLRVAWRNAR